LGLGVVAIVLLAVLLVTGVPLMFWYVPEPSLAYDRLVDGTAGAFPIVGYLRDLHRLASDVLVVVVVLHLARVFLMGSLGAQQRLNWLVGLGLLLVVLATAFTGYLLPWDRRAYWAATVGGELIALLPLVGQVARGVLWGGDVVGDDTLVRAFGWHVAALPAVGTLLVAYHLWRVRKAGGLARPAETGEELYGAELVRTRPALTLRELTVSLAVVAALLLVAIWWDAPLGLPGEPPQAVDPAKAPWFFLWIQELVGYHVWIGGAVPLLVLLLLIMAPWLERQPELAGRWVAPERRRRCVVFLVGLLCLVVLIVVANWRGPGWQLP
jgi:quinol-cytochrome oxidoreductase complex cytochrome b subunit